MTSSGDDTCILSGVGLFRSYSSESYLQFRVILYIFILTNIKFIIKVLDAKYTVC